MDVRYHDKANELKNIFEFLSKSKNFTEDAIKKYCEEGKFRNEINQVLENFEKGLVQEIEEIPISRRETEKKNEEENKEENAQQEGENQEANPQEGGNVEEL